jgi:Zn-finger nucleic acid-binding protein
MEEVTFGQFTVDRCTGCGGLWFDLMEQRHLRALPGSEQIDTDDSNRAVELNPRTSIDCPRCHGRMTRLRDTDRRDIEYEYCPVCNGAFFDAGEFRRYQQRELIASLRDWLRSSERYEHP